MSVAKTILNQLGGHKFRVMTGSKNFLDHGDALSMRLGRNSSNSNYLKVSLNSMDLYDVHFSKLTRKFEEKSVKEYNDVYADSLVEIFESHTGMYTKLF